jgi:hypothetical protein
MLKMNDNQHFLILVDINLYPEIKTNTIEMIEQIMNAYLLLNKNNIQKGINSVLAIEHYCQKFLNDNYLVLLNKIKPILEESNICIAQGEQVRFLYDKYHQNGKHYWDIGKQACINLEFALEKKLSYDGKNIKWEESFLDWVDSVLIEREEKSQHNPEDKLIFSYIEPRTIDKRVEIKNIILEETEKYVKQYKKSLCNLFSIKS